MKQIEIRNLKTGNSFEYKAKTNPTTEQVGHTFSVTINAIGIAMLQSYGTEITSEKDLQDFISERTGLTPKAFEKSPEWNEEKYEVLVDGKKLEKPVAVADKTSYNPKDLENIKNYLKAGYTEKEVFSALQDVYDKTTAEMLMKLSKEQQPNEQQPIFKF